MSNKNGMKRTLCEIGFSLGVLLAFPTNALATRGRVKVANNTIMTDKGTLIRGARVSLDIWDETPSQADIDTMKNSRGLNAFHIYAEYPGGGSAGYNSAKVDKVVDLADTNDLYVILTIGSGGGNGTFNQNFVTSFWNFYGPRYKDKTHVIYEVCNEPQAWSAPYNNNTLTMEKNAYTQIRGLAPDTHIMMMSYSQPINSAQAAAECATLGVAWNNASVAFHTYGIDGKEDSTLTSFYTAMKAKGIAYACTEPNLTLKAITTKLFERDGVSETQFINVHDVATNSSAFTSWITSNNICWTPDFGTWPSCAGGGQGGGGQGGGGQGGGGQGGTGGAATGGASGSGVGGRAAGGSSGLESGGSGGLNGTAGAQASGGSLGSAGSGGTLGAAGASATGAAGSIAAGGAFGAAGTKGTAGSSGAPTTGDAAPSDTGSGSNGCSCTVISSASSSGYAGSALALGLALLARARRRRVS